MRWLFALALAACGRADTESLLPTPGKMRDASVPMGQIMIVPASLDFGLVAVGYRTARFFEIRNLDDHRSAEVVIDPLVDPSFIIANVSAGEPFTVSRGGRLEIRIDFAPNTSGPHTDVARIDACGGTGCPIEVSLAGTTISLPLECEPVDFGTVTLDRCGVAMPRCYNASSNTYDATEAFVEGDDSFDISFTPGWVRPHEELYVPAWFCPRVAGAVAANVVIRAAKDESFIETTFPLSGAGR